MSAILKKKEIILLSILLLISVFFRFYQIRGYQVFLGDEGRDVIVMRKIFTEKKVPFLGPSASVGGFYLGPVYYWMAAPFLFLSRFDPVGPAYMVAALGLLTVFVIYKFLRDTLGLWPAYFASLLYAVNPLVVRYSRSSWNPNPLPLFSLLVFYFIYLGIKSKKLYYFFLSGACLGVAVQLHYLAVILVALSAVTVLVNNIPKNYLKILPLGIAGFLITFSPFLLFEIYNKFPNFKTILEFTTRGTTVKYNNLNLPWMIFDLGNSFLSELAKLFNNISTKLSFLAFTISGLIFLWKYRKDQEKRLFISIVLVWFIGGIALLRLYSGQIYDYYFGFMFPAPFLLFAVLVYFLWNNVYLRLISVLIVVMLAAFFINNGFYRTIPNHQIDQTEDIASFVIDKSESKPFNFALISDHNSDHAYRYFLEIKNHKPVELTDMVTGRLLVICESKKCEPLGNPAWEIVGFGRAEIQNEWSLEKYGIKVFLLNHWPGAPSPEGKPAQKG